MSSIAVKWNPEADRIQMLNESKKPKETCGDICFKMIHCRRKNEKKPNKQKPQAPRKIRIEPV